MNKLFVFNAGHEEALKVPLRQTYTPSKEIAKIRADLASLMLYFAEEGDYVWLWANGGQEDRIVNHQGAEVEDYASLPKLKLCPWALEGHLLKELERKALKLGVELALPEVSEAFMSLSHRSSALDMLQYLNEHWGVCSELFPRWFYPQGQRRERLEALSHYLAEQEAKGYTDLLIKRAYTSSGRGLLPLSLPCSEAEQEKLLKQVERWEGLSLEPKLKPLEDWAVEYYIDEGGEVSFVALSKFRTNSFGAYQGNVLKAQSELYVELYSLLGEDLPKLIDCHRAFFKECLKGAYEGYIGVDLFLYQSEDGILKLHPCIEINLRCTMGLLAHLLYEREQSICSDRGQKLEAYHVDYLKNSWQSLQVSFDNKVKLLTPLEADTSFVAFVTWE